MSKTSQALHNLRGFAILMVVAFHSVIAYMGSNPDAPAPFESPYKWLGTPIVDPTRWFGFDLFGAFQYVYLMHLMFFLSGLFVWPSLTRKGAGIFLKDRLFRLGAPFLIGVFMLMPVVYYPVYLVTATDPSPAQYWIEWTALPFWPCGPLWFLSFLLLLDITAVGVYLLTPRVAEKLRWFAFDARQHPLRFLFLLLGAAGLAYMPLAAVFPPWQWVSFGPFALQPSLAPEYLIYFFAGLAIGAGGLERGLLGCDEKLARHWRLWLTAAPASFLLWIIPTAMTVKGSALPGLRITADLGFVLSSATIGLALIAVFLRFAAAPTPLLGTLSKHAYGIYLAHYLFVVWLQYILLSVGLFAIGKATLVFAGSLFLSWGTVALAGRVPFGALLSGSTQRRLAEKTASDGSGTTSARSPAITDRAGAA